MAEAPQILELRNICKSFPGVKALDNVSISLNKGEIVGLVGENGAGKSTLMKVLTGVYSMDSGEIILEGKRVKINSPIVGREMGINIVYQELSVLRNLTVAENLFLGNLKTTKSGLVDWKAMQAEAVDALKTMDLDIDVNTPMRNLSIAQCQMVEICRACVVNQCKVLVMDEPTSSLVDKEIEYMFQIMMDLKEKGITIIYITHKLDELFRITDRVFVLKDGANSGQMVTAECTKDDIILAMVGRDLGHYYPVHDGKRGKPVLEVRNLCQGDRVKNVSFTAYAGEILGFAGLIGAGRTETMMSIFGAMPDVSGEVLMEGKAVRFKHPQEAIQAGVALAPEDRKNQGLVQIFSIMHNTTLANMKGILNQFGFLDLKKEEDVANHYIKVLNTATPDAFKRVRELSGGNQQKIIVGKWLFTDAKVLIFDEPTKGIDVGAKVEIYRLMRELANGGVAVIMVSSELPEVIGVSDRIMVMHDGELKGELSSEEATENRIMQMAIGGAHT
jgi:ribose transport system ATP-binding protein